ITDSEIFKLGGEWNNDRWWARVELATSNSDTVSPNLSTQLNFINPNPLTPLNNLDPVTGLPTADTSNDNSVPFIYDLRGGALTFGVDFDSQFAPTVAQLLDINNVVLDQVDLGRSTVENSEDAFRVDFSYDLDWKALTAIDFGYRFNETSSTNNGITDRIGGFSRLEDSPNGSLFSQILVPGPNNFGEADGRQLAFRNFVIVDPNIAFKDPQFVIDTLEAALIAHDSTPDLSSLAPSTTAFFEIDEQTHALYAQANFDYGMFRGNVGLRYLETEIDSLGNTDVGGVITPVVTSGKYDFILPRLNLVASPREDLILRLGYGRDIRRPDFDVLNTSIAFSTNENQAVSLGNPNLEPEEVDSLDLSVEWYFADAAVASIGYFRKERTNLFATTLESAAVFPDPTTPSGTARETNPSCPGGGIYNPAVQPNVLGDPTTVGLCVDFETNVNDPAETTQEGFEFVFQYDLSSFESELGWASGFGVLANYTIQDFSGGSVLNSSASRGTDIFNAINGIYDDSLFIPVTAVEGLLDFSENAYNVTLFYERYGLSARARYTWREAFRTDDTAAGASRNSTLGFPVVTGDRGQLNMSVGYAVNENLSFGVEAVNLTEEGIEQHCVNEGALLCFQGLPDRRVTVGAAYRF
ncbi:MAG: TonB-dependent receptor domain-containing protein, partial [Pseudomonadales bacterium]